MIKSIFKRERIIKWGVISISFMIFATIAESCQTKKTPPPEPYGPIPTARQLAWQEMEMYNMIEFSQLQYLEEKDWGYGNESPELINPKGFQPDSIVLRAKKAGFKGFLVQAKHHGGFCMWPTKTTDYNISKSPWKNGKGDWVGAWQKACEKYDMKFGIYLSPWDRHSKYYGTQKYLEIYREQLMELLTNYGPLFTVWFDGANGGTGYYGGANEDRRVDRVNYYKWDTIHSIVRKLQPGAVMFSDVGPDIRWVGNEKGYAANTSWETNTPYPPEGADSYAPGFVNSSTLPTGVRDGKFWMPFEADVSLRRRFTYHASDNNTVKSPEKLFDIYVHSVGRGGDMDLNLPINRDGQQDEADRKSLEAFGKLLKETFGNNLAQDAKLEASNIRGGDTENYGLKNLLNKDRYSYWATDDSITRPVLKVTLPENTRFNIIRLRENIKLGQRLDSVVIEQQEDGQWKRLKMVTSIGANRIIRLKNDVNTEKLRFHLYAPVCMALSDIGLFEEPKPEEPPKVWRDKDGKVFIQAKDGSSKIYYTLDETNPTIHSQRYDKPFVLPGQGTVKAIVINEEGRESEVANQDFDLSKKEWKITGSGADFSGINKIIDDNPNTFWEGGKGEKFPQSIVIDMGKDVTFSKVSYTPRQDGKINGIVKDYKFYVSENREQWTEIVDGYLPNMENSPVYRLIPLKKTVTARYLKLEVVDVWAGNNLSIAEIGIRK